jgi:hypothetical protein
MNDHSSQIHYYHYYYYYHLPSLMILMIVVNVNVIDLIYDPLLLLLMIVHDRDYAIVVAGRELVIVILIVNVTSLTQALATHYQHTIHPSAHPY